MNELDLDLFLGFVISLLLYARVEPSSPAFKDVSSAYDFLVSARSRLEFPSSGSSVL